MPQLRLCTHIKTNGIKCGSPALRHHTLCYFHYQWQRRDQRRIRLGGPAGMNKNSGIDLPLLDGPEAILVSIMEIQHAIVDQRIPVKTATALLYSLQLALQAKISAFGLGHSGSVRECPELDQELEMDRAKGMRPAKEKCAACPKRDDCLSPRNCRKLPKLPPGYRRQGDRLVRDPEVPSHAPEPEVHSFCHAEERSDEAPLSPARTSTVEVGAPFFVPASGAKGGSVPATTTTTSSSRAEHAPRAPHLPLSADAGSGAVEGSPEATAPDPTSLPGTTTLPLRESSPGRKPGVSVPEFPPSSAPHLPRLADVGSSNARRHIQPGTENRELGTVPTENPLSTGNSYAHCILGSNPHAHIDLEPKFPQLAEITREGN